MQLTLPLQLRETATFHNFYPGDNVAVITALQALLHAGTERFIYLWGSPGVGRTHLLHACCQALQGAGLSVMYLPLRTVSLSPDILQDMEYRDLVCIDDLDAVLGQAAWEEALHHFYNRARDNKLRLVIAGNDRPTHLPMILADLRSRLSWGLVFHVKGLTDVQKIKALQMHANERGLILSDEVGHFLLRYYPRDMTVLFNLLDTLDQASLVEKRKLTVPFVKRVLHFTL